MKLSIKDFSRYPLTREDARKVISTLEAIPDEIDFSEVVSISHCFADELFSRLTVKKQPKIRNASPFVARILCSVTAQTPPSPAA